MTERTMVYGVTSVDTTGKVKPIMVYVNNVTENEVEFTDDKYRTKLSINSDNIGITVTKLYNTPINEGKEPVAAKGVKDKCMAVAQKVQQAISGRTWEEAIQVLTDSVAATKTSK